MSKKDRIAAEERDADDDPGPRVRDLAERALRRDRAKRACGLGGWLVVLGMVIAAVFVPVLISLPGSRTAPSRTPLPDNEFTTSSLACRGCSPRATTHCPVVLAKLMLAALLGAIVGYRQRIHVEEYIVQAHVIIAFTGALMMIIIGNEIVRAFGLLGAGSISVPHPGDRDPKALASSFVTMGIGIAVGVGLFELAFVGAVLIVLIQGFSPRLPADCRARSTTRSAGTSST